MIKTNKEKELIIADKEVPVNFEINYFFKFFRDKTGVDLLSNSKLNIDDSDTIAVFDYLSSLLFAGNNAYQKLHKKEDPLSSDEVQDLIYTMTPVDALTLLQECSTVLRGDDEKNATPQAAKRKTR